MVQTRSNANQVTGNPPQGETSATGGRHPHINVTEAEALIQRPRTSAFDRLRDTRLARKGDLREKLKERREESSATSKASSEERRKAIEDKEVIELWRMYDRLEKRLDAHNPYRQAVFSEVTPFSRRVMSCPLPDNFKTHHIKAYNRTTNPQDHFARFGANVVMYTYPEEIKCRSFLATLEGQACEWFHKFPKGSIDKWSNLAHKFLEHFASSRRQKLPFSHLLNVKIRKGEELQEFINRWEKEARDVQGADDQALTVMLQATLPRGIRESYSVQDAPRYCKYHRNSTHNTSECVTLKKEMDQLIARGPPPRPERQAPGNRTWRRPAAAAATITNGEGQEDRRRHLGRDCEDLDEDERQNRWHLGCRFIMGGNTRGDSASSRRKWKNMLHLAEVQRPLLPKRKKKEPLIFTDEDYPPVLIPHRDALVVKVEINNVVVHQFKPRPAIKGQALADFVVECTAREVETNKEERYGSWCFIYTDGSSATDALGGRVMAISPEGFKAYYSIKFRFKVSNNEVVYEALLCGLRLEASLKAGWIQVRCDSKLIVGHVTGEFEAKDERMERYRDTALELLKTFRAYQIEQVPREENAEANIPSKLGPDSPEHI
ncbi:unnamed protein product [Cuscuta campestris]|uniref:RNase H type-1 domain-containing protein n=1 Tax=Cuscuta campestris TaxID=132261 RepID=A0A484LV26_9ASTE|nr:unnamed protein product [Cuscuta campestris]